MGRQKKPWTGKQYRTCGIFSLLAGVLFSVSAIRDAIEDGFPYAFIAWGIAVLWFALAAYSLVKSSKMGDGQKTASVGGMELSAARPWRPPAKLSHTTP